jgi:hypothetical protein
MKTQTPTRSTETVSDLPAKTTGEMQDKTPAVAAPGLATTIRLFFPAHREDLPRHDSILFMF